MRELWAIATAEAPVPPNIYVRYHQWQVSGLSTAELSQLAAEAKAAPEGAKANLYGMLSRLPSLDSDPVDIQIWATPDIWRLNMDYPDLPGFVSGSGDSARYKLGQWVRSGGDVTVLPTNTPSIAMMNPQREFNQHERTARAVWTGGLTLMPLDKFGDVGHTAKVSANEVLLIAEGTSGGKPAQLEVRLKGQFSTTGALEISQLTGTVRKNDGSVTVSEVSSINWGELPGIPGAYVPRLVTSRASTLLTKTQFVEARQISYGEVERVVSPPVFGRPDPVREGLILRTITEQTPDGSWIRATADGVTTGTIDSASTPRYLYIVGWAALGVLSTVTIIFVVRRHLATY